MASEYRDLDANTPPELSSGEIHVWRCPLRTPAADIGSLRAVLSDAERQRADRFRFDEHRHDFIASHAALRFTLSGYTSLQPAALEFAESNNRKPFLQNCDGLRFSLSHSGGMVLIAVALDRELGVDLERIRLLPDLEAIAKRFFAPGERDDLLSLPPERRGTAFFKCWTRKEAFVKAIGHGLLYPLDRFRVTLLPDRPAAFVEIDGRPSENTEWSLHDISPVDRYAAALAVEARGVNVRCWNLDIASFREQSACQPDVCPGGDQAGRKDRQA